jgi:mannose-6-phosphate isomerase-like protein (cupin superfamily)
MGDVMGLIEARRVNKPWGHEEIFAVTDRYVGKILFVKAGESLSLQYHEVKEETLRVLDGVVEFVTGDDPDRLGSDVLSEGAVFHIRPGTIHRMTAHTDCRLLEVSTPELNDVVRLEDRYGREGTSDP